MDSSAAADDSEALVAARRTAAEALTELQRVWNHPLPDAVVVAAKRYLAAAEDWADARREGA